VDRQSAQKLWTLIEPLVTHDGHEIVDIEVHGSRHVVVRIFLDAPGGISIDKCAEFSRKIGHLFDVEDPIKAAYTLEVSSPGLNRPLRLAKHFAAALGQVVALKVEGPGGKLQKLRGRLSAATGESITVEEQKDRVHTVKLTDVSTANVVYAWQNEQPQPKQRKK
jgi:ribosome maturation factor RimP